MFVDRTDKQCSVSSPTPDSIRSHLEELLASSVFARSERHREFLRFVVEETLAGHQEQLKETVIAAEVFGRDSSFDPRIDSVVRLQALRLRERLEQYYATVGHQAGIVIELPKGAYVPLFHARSHAGPKPPHRWPPITRKRILIASGVALAIAACAWWMLHARAVKPRSIAVLPFLDLSDGGGNQHIADGLVEDLTTEFSRMPSLRTISRTSAFEFRGRGKDVRKIGDSLGVSTVLEGSIRRQGQRIKVTAQLIETANGYHLWSNTFDADLADLANLEGDIARSVQTALGLSYVVVKPVHSPPTAAREEYWRGHFLLTDYRLWSGSKAFFERAVAIDPRYTEAWASLAACRALDALFMEAPADTEVPKAVQAAETALRLNEAGAAEAHFALAIIGCSHRRDWTVAEREFRRALEIDPACTLARLHYAVALADRDRIEEALRQDALARRSDPSSVRAVTTNEATILYFARRHDEGIQLARRHLEMDAKLTSANYALACNYAALGKHKEAVECFRKLLDEDVVSFPVLGRLAYVLLRAGRNEEANQVIGRIGEMERKEPRGTSFTARAQIAAAKGQTAEAIDYLVKASALAVPDANHIGVEPIYDSLRNEPAFQALCTRMGLPNRKGSGR